MMCCSYHSLKPSSPALSMSVVRTHIRSLSTGSSSSNNVILWDGVLLSHAVESESSTPDVTAARLWKRGREYDEFAVGDVYRHHWGRTVTEADAIAFATQTL